MIPFIAPTVSYCKRAKGHKGQEKHSCTTKQKKSKC